jgi:hypothetical protein
MPNTLALEVEQLGELSRTGQKMTREGLERLV